MSYRVLEGDCVESMAAMPAGSVDAVVCDPPYGIRFMGKAWDGADIDRQARVARDEVARSQRERQDEWPGEYAGFGGAPAAAGSYDLSLKGNAAFQDWCEAWATEALRVLKPGGHLLAFGGSRTSHRLACAIEDAGFEIRDRILYMGGGGAAESLGAEVDWLYGSG